MARKSAMGSVSALPVHARSESALVSCQHNDARPSLTTPTTPSKYHLHLFDNDMSPHRAKETTVAPVSPPPTTSTLSTPPDFVATTVLAGYGPTTLPLRVIDGGGAHI